MSANLINTVAAVKPIPVNQSLTPLFCQLTKEYVAMQRDPPPFIWAAPDEKNILNC